MEPFNIGDVVELKTGSPEMVVYEADGSGVVVAFYYNGEIKREWIPVLAIRKIMP